MSHAAARAALLHMLPAYLASADVEAETVFRRAGMTVEDVRSGKIVRRSQINAALAFAADYVGTAEIGLALGDTAEPGRLGPIGMAMRAGATVESCMRAQAAEMPSMQSHVDIRLHKRGDDAVWTHRLVGDDESAWLLYEGVAAFNVKMLKCLLGDGWAPERVTFPHACKGRRQVYEEFFQAPVVFARDEELGIHFRRDALSRPLFGGHGRYPDDGVAAFAAEGLERFRLGPSEIELAVGRMIDATMPHKPITLHEAATVLGLSPRTLQRKLDEHGAVFEQILDSRRHGQAVRLLTEPGMSVTTVAMLLGYSDTAHFHRAFRRWEGQSPTDYRRFGAILLPGAGTRGY
ncbi:AraC family transcriptional regulator [Bosea sp. BK604]|uniref:helix-turn-helix transcriptional regulator n=1 Tax=Bosea sp. BK604 TaxID=2512180 RepID=UPI0010E326A2|nr:AraC family transcriptional regulator [Bosea sp. BK604]TCR65480.1 helix-turn-helix protein [Bosea sp. BK604]